MTFSFYFSYMYFPECYFPLRLSVTFLSQRHKLKSSNVAEPQKETTYACENNRATPLACCSLFFVYYLHAYVVSLSLTFELFSL